MIRTIEGIYQDGQIQLTELPQDISDRSQVLVTFFDLSKIDPNKLRELIDQLETIAGIEQGFEELNTRQTRPIGDLVQEMRSSMTSESHDQAVIVRTERGLAIAGTRITLYDIMDYVKVQYPPKFIQGLFELTDEQINVALSYIEANRDQVEAEYQQVLKEAEELRHYYEEKNRDLIAQIAAQPPKPGTEAAWEKLKAAKAKRESRT